MNPSCCGSNWSVGQRTQLVLFQLVFIMQFVIVCMYWFAIYDWGNVRAVIRARMPLWFNVCSTSL